MICRICQVPCTENWRGVYVHTDEVPKNIEPHAADPIAKRDYVESTGGFISIRDAAQDMLDHHNSLHPEAGCQWAKNLKDALITS
jgi:RNA polymerase subunit RPABC4/transcription elongation factor Spt4